MEAKTKPRPLGCPSCYTPQTVPACEHSRREIFLRKRDSGPSAGGRLLSCALCSMLPSPDPQSRSLNTDEVSPVGQLRLSRPVSAVCIRSDAPRSPLKSLGTISAIIHPLELVSGPSDPKATSGAGLTLALHPAGLAWLEEDARLELRRGREAQGLLGGRGRGGGHAQLRAPSCTFSVCQRVFPYVRACACSRKK